MKAGELIEILSDFDDDAEVEVCGVCENPVELQTAVCDVVYIETHMSGNGDICKVCLRYEQE